MRPGILVACSLSTSVGAAAAALLPRSGTPPHGVSAACLFLDDRYEPRDRDEAREIGMRGSRLHPRDEELAAKRR